MRALRYLVRLGREFVGFAMQNKAWWIIPIVIALILLAVAIVSGQLVASGSIYTLF